MKSTKTNLNSAKGPDKGKIVNKLYCILLTKEDVIPTYSIFQHVYSKHNLVSFFGRIVELQRSFLYILFFQEKLEGNQLILYNGI
jgi:hypothetical protein